MRVLVTGSRDWKDYRAVNSELDQTLSRCCSGTILTVVHGACPTGADASAHRWVDTMRNYHEPWTVIVTEEPHPADWAGRGSAAGPIRNQAMVDAGADLCLAFILDGSRGATDCARRAEQAGIPIRLYKAATT